jgi:hypothetical protein
VKFLKLIALVFGVLCVLMGGLWIGQGLNIIRWPESSFMLGVPAWSWRGMILALAGIALVWWSRRR